MKSRAGGRLDHPFDRDLSIFVNIPTMIGKISWVKNGLYGFFISNNMALRLLSD